MCKGSLPHKPTSWCVAFGFHHLRRFSGRHLGMHLETGSRGATGCRGFHSQLRGILYLPSRSKLQKGHEKSIEKYWEHFESHPKTFWKKYILYFQYHHVAPLAYKIYTQDTTIYRSNSSQFFARGTLALWFGAYELLTQKKSWDLDNSTCWLRKDHPSVPKVSKPSSWESSSLDPLCFRLTWNLLHLQWFGQSLDLHLTTSRDLIGLTACQSQTRIIGWLVRDE